MPLDIGVPRAASQACSWIGTALAVESEAGGAEGRAIQVQIYWAKCASFAIVTGSAVDVAQLALVFG